MFFSWLSSILTNTQFVLHRKGCINVSGSKMLFRAPIIYCTLMCVCSRTWTPVSYHGRGVLCWHVWTPPKRCGSTKGSGSALVSECSARELPSSGDTKLNFKTCWNTTITNVLWKWSDMEHLFQNAETDTQTPSKALIINSCAILSIFAPKVKINVVSCVKDFGLFMSCKYNCRFHVFIHVYNCVNKPALLDTQ